MELSELSARLEDILNEKGDDGIDLVFSILLEICQDTDKANLMRISQSSFNALRKNVAMGVSESKDLTLQGNLSRQLIITQGLYSNDERWVKSDWENLEVVRELMEMEEERGYLEDDQLGKNDSAIIAENEMDADNEVMIPKETIENPHDAEIPLNDDEKKKFKRLLTNAQNHYRCGDYKQAYDICLALSNEVENNSIQLQELLLLSIFKMFGARQIVKDFLENKGQMFLKIKLYAENIKKLKSERKKEKLPEVSIKSKPKKLPTDLTNASMMERADLNVRLICRLLINEVRKSYTEKYFNGKKFDYIDQQETPEIRAFYTKVIQLVMSIYAIQPMTTFFGKLMVEMSGGGAVNWLRIDQNFELKENESLKFPLLHNRNDLLCAKYAPLAFKEYKKDVFDKNASYMLLKSLRGKYIKMKKTRYKWRESWKAHQASLNSFLIGYALYKDQKFLEKPLFELSGRAGLSWLDINNSGELITSKECTVTRFNSLGVLDSISRIPGLNDSENIVQSVANHIAHKKLKDLKKTYRTTPNLLSLEKNKQEIESLINIVKVAQACYNRVKDIQFLELSKEILWNNQKIIWVNKRYFGRRYIQSNASFCLELKFDALKTIWEIEALIQLHQQLNLTSEADSEAHDIEIQIPDLEIDETDNNESQPFQNEPEADLPNDTDAAKARIDNESEHSQNERSEETKEDVNNAQ